MNHTPCVSILIPAYNAQDTLESAITSARHQTYANIEIVVVDDGSNDSTASVAHKCATADSRIKIISHDKNIGRLEARRTGVRMASGDYILFLDADDELEENTCSTCLEIASSFDVVQFGFDVRYHHAVTDEDRSFTDSYCQPPDEEAFGDDIPHIFFRDRKAPWSLCGKMFKASVLKVAFSHIISSSINQAEDAYACFIIASIANSYKGIPSFRGYIYNIDLGTSDAAWELMTIDQFNYSCKYIDSMRAISRYVEEGNLWDKLSDDYDRVYIEHLYSVTGRLLNQVIPQDKPAALDSFIEQWPKEDVAGSIANVAWDDCAGCLSSFHGSKMLSPSPKSIRTVALYYGRLGIGGAERVARDLMLLWHRMGLRVVFLADEPEREGDYRLPSDIKRVVLPSVAAVDRETYSNRAGALQQALSDNSIDLLVHFAWDSPLIGWDALSAKIVGVPVIAYTQSNFSSLFRRSLPWGLQLPAIYKELEGVITLSESDSEFWGSFCKRAWTTINPLTLAPTTEGRSDLHNNEIVWVGRLHHEEKQPVEALEIMAHVVRHKPNAHLTIVGPPTEDCTEKDLRWKADQLGIAGNVSIVGPTSDVHAYLQRASVFLLTSSFEGYCLALAEAKATGLPTVMYSLPYLELSQGNRGILPIDANDYAPYLQLMKNPSGRLLVKNRHIAAANAIVKVLDDESLKRNLADAAFNHMVELESFDFEELWRHIFRDLSSKPQASGQPTQSTQAMATMMSALISGSRFASSILKDVRASLSKAQDDLKAAQNEVETLKDGLNQTRQERDALEEQLERANASLQAAETRVKEIEDSTTWKVGRLATWIPRKAKDAIRDRRHQ